MSSNSSSAPNGLPWLAEDNFIEWQEQVMAYLERKQLAQFVEGWSRFLAPVPPTDLNDTAAVAAWKVTHDEGHPR